MCSWLRVVRQTAIRRSNIFVTFRCNGFLQETERIALVLLIEQQKGCVSFRENNQVSIVP